MIQEVFNKQIDRLKVRFNEKHFDLEFTRLAWLEVKAMSESRFIWQVNTWLGSKPVNKPPMMAEFTEARLAEEKLKRSGEAAAASRAFHSRDTKPISEVLKPHFGQVTSIQEALEIARMKIRTQNGEDPGGGPKGAA